MGMISKIYNSKAVRMRGLYEEETPMKPTMTWTTTRFLVYYSYDIRKKLKNFGFRYDPNARAWWTSDRQVALKAKKYADRLAKIELSK